MGRLKSAQAFSKTPIYDGYSGTLLYYGRVANHDDHSSSGATSRRRTLTTDPDTTAPPRAVVKVMDEHWLVGTSNPDDYKGEQIRRNYDLKKATDLATMYEPGNLLLSEPGVPAYVRREWYRDQLDAVTSSEYDTMWNVFIAGVEHPARGQYLQCSDGLLRIRNTYLAQELLWICECDQLDYTSEPATWVSIRIDRVTDTEIEAGLSVRILQLDMAKFYKYEVQSDSDYRPGDKVVMIAQAAGTPAVGDHIKLISGEDYRIITVKAERDAWALKVRLA